VFPLRIKVRQIRVFDKPVENVSLVPDLSVKTPGNYQPGDWDPKGKTAYCNQFSQWLVLEIRTLVLKVVLSRFFHRYFYTERNDT